MADKDIDIQNKVQLFNDKKIRSVWDSEEEQWYFSVIDVIAVLTDSVNPRDYWFKLNKKVKNLARKSALSYKAQQNAIVVVEDFDFEAPKTKDGVALLNNLKVDGKKTLIVLPEVKKNVNLSVRNIQRVEVMTASALNTYKVMNANVLVVTENALKLVDETFNK